MPRNCAKQRVLAQPCSRLTVHLSMSPHLQRAQVSPAASSTPRSATLSTRRRATAPSASKARKARQQSDTDSKLHASKRRSTPSSTSRGKHSSALGQSCCPSLPDTPAPSPSTHGRPGSTTATPVTPATPATLLTEAPGRGRLASGASMLPAEQRSRTHKNGQHWCLCCV